MYICCVPGAGLRALCRVIYLLLRTSRGRIIIPILWMRKLRALVKELFSLAHWLRGWTRSQLLPLLAFDFDLCAAYIYTYMYVYVWMGFPGGSDGKESACNAGDLTSVPGLGRSPGERYIVYVAVQSLSLVWLWPRGLQGPRSSPGSPIHGILQARTLEWVAISFSRGSFQPRGGAQVSCTAGRFFTTESPVLVYVYIPYIWASLIAQLVKNLSTVQETPVWFLVWEDLLERE